MPEEGCSAEAPCPVVAGRLYGVALALALTLALVLRLALELLRALPSPERLQSAAWCPVVAPAPSPERFDTGASREHPES